MQIYIPDEPKDDTTEVFDRQGNLIIKKIGHNNYHHYINKSVVDHDNNDRHVPKSIVHNHLDSPSVVSAFSVGPNKSSLYSNFCADRDIKENATKYQLALDVPGIKRDALKAVVDGKILTVSGMRKSTSGDWTSFSIDFGLCHMTIDVSSITANLMDGVLTITAKKNGIKAPQEINITYNNEEGIQQKKKNADAARQQKLRQQRENRIKQLSQGKQVQLALAIPSPDDSVSLLIKIVSCHGLLKSDLMGLSDPYVRILLGNTQLHKTKYISQNLNPVYSEAYNNTFVFNGKVKRLNDHEGLHLVLMDYDLITPDDPLGDLMLSTEELVTMRGEHAFRVSPPTHLAGNLKDAGCIKIRIQHATRQDRKKYRQPSTVTFWQPPSKEISKMYRREMIIDQSSSKSFKRLSSGKSVAGEEFC